ncbi:HAD family hydrolase [Sphingomonas nostoxanthinifaciens]|uniref:HAD family hydrolase n=1 Tax=Sphingomonas nostoxanthinifaciens TaxID=2872652 RepID=UPI001CC1D2F3|nr:HAD family phosphatase [Sphingomonas nostoxanthinifaciens]UAK24322.1 HAD family phosphatase [Sphingomonas nostoxanthinifaciens]
MQAAAILFDFDGVLIESEYASAVHIAATLTTLGHPTTPEVAIHRFTGLAGSQFVEAVTAWIGGPLPQAFREARAIEDARAVAEGVAPVAGAVAFVASLPADLPIAVVSSSTSHWINAHLAHIGLADRFGRHVYSGREHVVRGKPAPNLYLHAAAQLGVPIEACVIIEDSVVGATGAVASGGYVIGLCAATHCDADHGDRLRALGVQALAADYDEVAAILDFTPAE